MARRASARCNTSGERSCSRAWAWTWSTCRSRERPPRIRKCSPGPVLAALRSALAGINRDAEFAGRVERDGGRVLAIPPERHVEFLREEIERWSSLVTRYNVTVD